MIKRKTDGLLSIVPEFTHNIWGGTRLRKEFSYDVKGDDIGECWGIAAHQKGDCRIANGCYKNMKLSQLWKEEPQLFGNTGGGDFPLLVKLIDARQDLSIQVHPGDEYASRNEQGATGKTECWYIIDCEENATIVIGHNARTKAELQEMIEQKQWGNLIKEIPIKKGDFIPIVPGTVHAIKGGTMLLETQQNSDITYRIYDYDRYSNGVLRKLHVEKSLDVISVPSEDIEKIRKSTLDVPENELFKIWECKYYKVFELKVLKEARFQQRYPFLLISILNGNGVLNDFRVKKGDHLILVNNFGEVRIAGNLNAICSTI